MEQGRSQEEEEAHLMVALTGNGYPSSFIHCAAAVRAPRKEVTVKESMTKEEKPPLA